MREIDAPGSLRSKMTRHVYLLSVYGTYAHRSEDGVIDDVEWQNSQVEHGQSPTTDRWQELKSCAGFPVSMGETASV